MTPLFPDQITEFDKYGPAMEITEQDAADEYLAACAEHHLRTQGGTWKQAIEQERRDIAYWAGRYSRETRERVERLFKCAHPFLGPIANGAPSMQDCFKSGILVSEAIQEERYLQNIDAPVIEVRHADLKRWSEDSAYKSCCPACPNGVLLVHRSPDNLLKLRRLDYCISCAQRFRYTDARIGSEEFEP